MVLQRQNTEIVTLGSQIHAGGEGRICPIAEDPLLVAKVYHQITDAHVWKLAAMIENPPADPMAGKHTSIAWPVDFLFTTDSDPRVVGYLMPLVTGMRPVFDFYNPKTRRQHCPLFNYAYMYRAARNLASAVHALHARGYVIGDVNESNILVSDTTLVTLVDTDSFQVPDAKHNCIHRCPVGKPEFTPPELQGWKFADVDRTPEHDLFGLGVLIFQMLMEGQHPFAGKFQGLGDPPPVEQRISSGHFPHGRNGKVPYDPPPTGLPFATLNPNLQQLFRQCFVDGHASPKARPDAQTWRYALQGAEDAMRKCTTNDQHFYSGHLGVCPWCVRVQQLGGRDAFPSKDAVRRGEHLLPASRQHSTSRPKLRVVSLTTATARHSSSHQTQTASPTRVPAWTGTSSPAPRQPPASAPPAKSFSLWGAAKVAFVLISLFVVARSLFWSKPEDVTAEVAAVEKALHEDPNFTNPLWGKRAHLLAKGGNKNSEQALEEYKNGHLAEITGDYEAELRAYKHSAELDSGFPWSFNNVAWLLATCPKQTMRNGSEAVRFAKEAVRVGDDYWSFLDTLAAAYAEAGDLENAVKTAELALKKAPDGERADVESRLNAFKQKQTPKPPPPPDEALKAYRLGLEYDQAGRQEEAMTAYQEAVRRKPDFAEAWNNLGTMYAVAGRRSEAIAAIKKSVDLQPNQPMGWNNLGKLYFDDKKFSEAIAAHRRAVGLQEDYADAWNGLGLAYGATGQTQDAVSAFDQATKRKPDFALAWANLAYAYNRLERSEKVIEALEQATKFKPDSVQYWYDLGNAYGQASRYDSSQRAFQQALKVDPRASRVWRDLGVTYSMQSDSANAMACFKKAIELDPNDDLAWSNLGSLYSDLRRLSEAQNALAKAVGLNPKSSHAWYNLCNTYIKSGQTSAARQAWQRLQDIDPQSAEQLRPYLP